MVLDRLCKMQATVEGSQSVYLEFARYLAPGTDSLTDPAFETYHGVAAVSLAGHLSEPGQTEANLQAVVTMAYLEAQQAGTLPQPGLPRPDPPTNAKVYQQPLLALSALCRLLRLTTCLCFLEVSPSCHLWSQLQHVCTG